MSSHHVHRIAAGYDGSSASLAAARWAGSLADRLDAKLTVVAAVNRRWSEMTPEDAEQFLADERRAIEAELDGEGVPDRLLDVRESDPADLLAGTSADHDLLVLGTRPEPGLTRRGFVSLTHHLAHVVACPMVVVPADARPLVEAPLIVVGVDGTDGNRAVLAWARRFAVDTGVRIAAAYVTNPMYDTFDSAGWYGAEEVAAHDETAPASLELIERPGGHPAATLEAIARERGAGLVVVGARWHHAFGGHLLGAVPSELLHHPTCPVMVVSHDVEAQWRRGVAG